MLSNDNVRNCFKHKLNVRRVCCTCDVSVDCFACRVLVESDKLITDESHSILERVLTCSREEHTSLVSAISRNQESGTTLWKSRL